MATWNWTPLPAGGERALQEMLSIDLNAAHRGVDGCGLTTYGIPLTAIARGFAVASADAAFQRAQDAMAAHPFLVAGTGRFDTALLEAAGAGLTAEDWRCGRLGGSGAPNGPGIAIN